MLVRCAGCSLEFSYFPCFVLVRLLFLFFLFFSSYFHLFRLLFSVTAIIFSFMEIFLLSEGLCNCCVTALHRQSFILISLPSAGGEVLIPFDRNKGVFLLAFSLEAPSYFLLVYPLYAFLAVEIPNFCNQKDQQRKSWLLFQSSRKFSAG